MSLGRGDAVMFVTSHFRPHVGGVEHYVEQLAETLHERHGLRCVVVTTSRQIPGGAPPDSPLIVRTLPAPIRVFNTPVGLGWTRAMRRLIQQEQVALVNAHAPVPVLADLAARAVGTTPFVLTYHTGPIDRGIPIRAMLGDIYERFALPATARRATRVICSSEHVASSFAPSFAGRSVVIPPAVDMELFSPTNGPPPAPGRILFASSLDRATAYKALGDLLEAMRRLSERHPHAVLAVAGDGDARASYEDHAVRLGIEERVEFLGRLDRRAMAEAYHRAEIICHPTHHDSFPTVLVEGMACGRPVVSTLVGGIPSLVTHDHDGLLYPPGDLDALTESLSRLLSSPGRASEMGSRGREAVAATLSRAVQADRTLETFREAVDERATRPRRVAIIAPYFPPKTGGVERYAHEVTRAVAAAPDMTALVITSNHGGRRRVSGEVGGVPVIRLGRWFTVSNTPMNPLWPIALHRLLKKQEIDVVNVHSPVPFLADSAIVLARCPVVFTYHSGSMQKTGRRSAAIGAYERWVLPWMFRHTSVLIAVSRASLANQATSTAEMISPGVDTDVFTPGPSPPSASSPVLLFVGRLDRSSSWKGVHILLRAFALVREQMPAARLSIAGDGDAREKLETLAARLGLEGAVDFPGMLDRDDLLQAYRNARVLVLPSLTDAESFGMTLIEAMACGRPTIGSRVGGIPEVIVEGETGLMVTPGSSQELAAACLRVLGDDELADRLGRNGRAKAVSSHRWTDGLERYLAIFRELAPRPGHQPEPAPPPSTVSTADLSAPSAGFASPSARRSP